MGNNGETIFTELTSKITEKLQGLSPSYKFENKDRLFYEISGIKEFRVSINDHLYFIINDYTKGGIETRYTKDPKDFPLYSIVIQHSYDVQFFCGNKEIKFINVDQILEDYFSFPGNIDKDKECIIEKANETLKTGIPISLIEYDLRTKSYFLTDWKDANGRENQFWRRYFDKDKDKEKDNLFELAKYMSFETFIKTLQSGKMRINSIVGMNDSSELNFIDQLIYNKGAISTYNSDEAYEPIYEANKCYITCFTTLIDDLNMWRLYGNDSTGVCLIFNFFNPKPILSLHPVCYVKDGEDLPINKAKELIESLGKDGISFSFNSLSLWQNFFKSNSYSYEKEYRLLVKEDESTNWTIVKESGILIPYIEKSLKPNSNLTNVFPLCLSKVILGSKMKSKEENRYQLYKMCEYLNMPFFSVEFSKEKTYR